MENLKSEYGNTSNPRAIEIYSSIFSFLLLIFLLSFIFIPGITLSTVSTNFRWRSNLIDLYAFFRLKAGDHVFNNAVIGKDGWLFYTGESSIQNYQNSDSMKRKMLNSLQKELTRLSTDLKEQGITLLIVIPPNKSTIYSQYMPDEIPVIGEKSRLDQFVEFMDMRGGVSIIDLRKTLLDASRLESVYHKTDTHWNDMGAYYGYVEIMNALSLEYPNLEPHSLSDFERKSTGVSTRDLPLLMGISNYEEEGWMLVPKFEIRLIETSVALPDGIHKIRTVTNSHKQLPELLIFSDSFYGTLARFIEPHFSRVKNIPFTTDDETWSLDWIKQENPDVVIIEFVERYLDFSLPALIENSSLPQ